ncbi:hypothetical protein VSH64_01125 [Amycolatopsis rhabdoformis]|uniref:Uncharacterized protein n=1 Tax=Amycolatopsis rhabdoformis TaxID=1448059 RepID=A0ABZ1IBC6_9PSEU|nr:hypothetical protein [Amycolatopsis rhabdoformis]WSE30745.1 hypothetical protein VSH64_01125 [Amycolatopsis rhabdoformis]
METYLTFMLIRFGLIAGGLVVLGLIAFGVALALKRRGHGDRVRDGVAKAARFAGRALDDRRSTGARRGGGLGSTLAREALRRVDRR